MKSKYFDIVELVPKDLVLKIGYDTAWKLLDQELIETIDKLKENTKLTMCINYGTMKYRGYRPDGCNVGKSTGAHYKGKAVDIDFYKETKLIPAKEIRDQILLYRNHYPYIKGIEDEVSWVHIDTMKRPGVPEGAIAVFKPNGSLNIV
jgi:hypothetical protein